MIWAVLLLVAYFLPHRSCSSIPTIVAAALWMAKLAYEHFDGFNLAVNRMLLWAVNGRVEWEMRGVFSGDVDEQDVAEVLESVGSDFEGVKIVQQAPGETPLVISSSWLLVLKAYVAAEAHPRAG